ncbi:MAG: hypothetical protein ABS81_05465 [Pseudonocardia sp. SCN 72-86]|nr:MAG: hypothetical protein ABS81_05465 [Pseudonocardia sp. SCN 72-86]
MLTTVDAEVDRVGPRQPLWSSVLIDLRRRIAANEFIVDFPGELELVAHYGVSRTTVRAALAVLREEGVVAAARGRRPRMVGDRGVNKGSLVPILFAGMGRGQARRTAISRVQLVEPGCHDGLPTFNGAPALVYVCRVHYAHNAAVIVDRSWFPVGIGESLLAARDDVASEHEDLLRLCGAIATSANEELRPAVAETNDGALLGCGPGAPVFVLDRTALADEITLEFRRMHLRPSWLRLQAGPTQRDVPSLGVVLGAIT